MSFVVRLLLNCKKKLDYFDSKNFNFQNHLFSILDKKYSGIVWETIRLINLLIEFRNIQYIRLIYNIIKKSYAFVSNSNK